ncbi:MAG TPA: LysE family translocator [Rhizomicrobium sp.]|jgi:threonine/homoserine/homoserine lactone efflux protein
MSWQIWGTFAVLETVLCFTPGPAVLLVLSQALSRGAGRTVFSILGIIGANTVYFVLSATGVGAILMASYTVFFAIKWIGAAYLVWLGLNEIFGTPSLSVVRPAQNDRADARRMFLKGFILQMSNPKALVFFTALVPQFLNPDAPLAMQVVILAATSMTIEFCVQLFYAVLAGRFSHLATRPSFAKITGRIAGSILVVAGAGMAALKRT